MILPDGTLAVVPARFLDGLRNARKHTTKTMTVRYADIRSVCIPVKQFLVELVLGLWVGSSHDDVLKFASGEGGPSKPRSLVIISVTGEVENRKR